MYIYIIWNGTETSKEIRLILKGYEEGKKWKYGYNPIIVMRYRPLAMLGESDLPGEEGYGCGQSIGQEQAVHTPA